MFAPQRTFVEAEPVTAIVRELLPADEERIGSIFQA